MLTTPLAKLPLVGTKKQIAKYLANLKLMHCIWEEDGVYHLFRLPEPPKRGISIINTNRYDFEGSHSLRYLDRLEDNDQNSDIFTYYLTNVCHIPPQGYGTRLYAKEKDELCPLFWDSLLQICGIEVD